MSLVDQAESRLKWPNLLREAEEVQRVTGEVVEQYGDQSHIDRFGELKKLLRTAAATNKPQVLQVQLDEMDAFRRQLLWSQDETWIECAVYLEKHRSLMSDQSRADKLFSETARAIELGDGDHLKAACRQLIELLPSEERQKARGAYSGSLLG